MMNEKFSTRLARVLSKKGIKPIELSNKTGLPKSGISQYLKDVCVPKNKNILKIAEALNVNPLYLEGYNVPMEVSSLEINDKALNLTNSQSAIVFVYGTIPAGIPLEMIEDIIDTEEISVDMLKGSKQFFGLKIKGNSMYPEYQDGDVIICEKTDDCESGDDCVVMVNGYDGTFKKVIKDFNKQTICLQPINTSLDENGIPLYEAKTYSKEEIEQLPIRIIGVEIELRRKNKKKRI